LEGLKEFRAIFEYDHKGICAILQHYGDVETQLSEFLIEIER